MSERNIEIAAELRRLELMLLDPEVRRNPALIEELLAADFVEFGSSGRVLTRAATLEMLSTESDFQVKAEDFACRMLPEHVALVTYRSVPGDPNSGEQVEALRSSIWVNRRGKWKMHFHQGTRTGKTQAHEAQKQLGC